jgi:very-short-patch-repair endonuclease
MKVGYRTRSTYGCPYCNNFLALSGHNDIASQYPEIAEKEWDYEKNKLCPNQVVAESGKKAWWLCAKGHSYQQAIDNHVKTGQGCPYCANKRVLQGYNDVTTTHPVLVKEWSEKNHKKPEECIAGSHQKIIWKCKDCGNEWSAPIKSRAYSKQGCPKCALAYKSSEPEQAMFYYLHKAFPSAVNSYKAEWLGRMEIDVYIPELQVGIEFDGGKWHRNLDKDIRKSALLHERGIKLIRVRDERNPSIDDGSIIVSVTRDIDKGLVHMETVVERLFECINEICGISAKVDIDVKRDLLDIQSLFDAKKKGRSVASNPEQIAEWNREKNVINPDRISERSHRKVWWKCSICGAEWQGPPHTKKGTGCITCRKSAVRRKRSCTLSKNGVIFPKKMSRNRL